MLVRTVARAIGEAAIKEEPRWRLSETDDGRLLLLDDDSNSGADLRLLAEAAVGAYGANQSDEVTRQRELILEMLDALKAVVRVTDRKTVEFDAARAAIAKAEHR